MKSVSMALAFLLVLCSVQGQNSILGKWKRISSVVVNADGSKTDLQSDMVKLHPCVADIVYEFIAGGKTTADASACDAGLRKMMERINAKTTWVQKGNKVTTSTTDGSVPTTTCTVSFSGNTMTWKAANTIIVYRKV